AGFLETPHTLGHVHLLSDLLGRSLPSVDGADHSPGLELALQAVAVLAVLAGLSAAWWFYAKSPRSRERFAATPLRQWWLAGWGFDALYDRTVVRPLVALAN